MSFLALDAMLGWKVKKYDSSWLEWGNLSGEEGTLASDSPWLTNNTSRSEAINEVIATGGAIASCPYAADADAVNENDKQICATGIQNTDCNGNIN
ncbi:MAG: hypothetical protein L0922_03410 [Candidatus Mariimomonas ferrooxydans]